MAPIKEYRVLNMPEQSPIGAPDPGFLWIFPKNGNLWVRNSDQNEWALGGIASAGSDSIPVWLPTIPVINVGDYFLYEDDLYRAIEGSTSLSPRPPDTFEGTYWVKVDFSELTHAQNTDAGLARYLDFITGSGVADLSQSLRNYFQILPGTESGQLSISLQTFNDMFLPPRENPFLFITYIPKYESGYTAVFQTDANQEVSAIGLELGPGDWAVWQCIAEKTRLLASNKMSAEIGASIDEFSTEILPNILLSGASATDTDANDRVSILNKVDEGTTTTNSSLVTLQAWAGDLYDANEFAGYMIDLYYPIGQYTEQIPIVSHTTGGLLTLEYAPSASEANVEYRIAEEFWAENEFAGKYVVLNYPNLTAYAPEPRTAHRIFNSSYDGVLTVVQPITYTGDCDYQIHDPYLVDPAQDNFLACINTNNIVVFVQDISADDERNRLTIYRENNNDPDMDYTAFLFFNNPVKGSNLVTLQADGELLTLAAHNYGTKHWDEENRNAFCVCLNANIVTADTTSLTNTSNLPIVADDWSMNHPIRFEIETIANSLVWRYTSLIKRTIEFVVSVTIVRTGGTPTVTVTMQRDVGAGWVDILDKSIVLSNNSPNENLTFPVSKMVSFGDKFRMVARTGGSGYYISEMSITTSNSNA
jgi:hypothetical protein